MSTDYPATKNSNHSQTPLWPDQLPVSEKRLFIIERSKNANLVIYDANLVSGNKFVSDNPIDVYWLDYAVSRTPPKTDLIWLEKKMAYGYESDKVKDKEEFTVSLKALTGKYARKGKLCFDRNGQPVIVFTINGKEANVLKIYVNSQETLGVIPKVLYVELYGRDPITFEDVYERITID